MEDIRLKIWSKLVYKDPRDWLLKLAKIEKEIIPCVASQKAKTFRTNKLKWAKEARQAGIFTYGMSLYKKKTVNFALHEADDYDFIARFIDKDIDNYIPVQLKEWVPSRLNQSQSLATIYEELKKYSSQNDLTVAIYVCRDTKIDAELIRLKGTQFAGVWLFGASSRDKRKWFLWGDVQASPDFFEFDYPVE
ncbi:MAG: hypothetical protein WBD86_00510 [Microgenomates group bacterium]